MQLKRKDKPGEDYKMIIKYFKKSPIKMKNLVMAILEKIDLVQQDQMFKRNMKLSPNLLLLSKTLQKRNLIKFKLVYEFQLHFLKRIKITRVHQSILILSKISGFLSSPHQDISMSMKS